MERLSGRCATCTHWENGDRLEVLRQLNDAETPENFLSFRDSWAASGFCSEIRVYVDTEMTGEVDGTFGCVLWEAFSNGII